MILEFVLFELCFAGKKRKHEISAVWVWCGAGGVVFVVMSLTVSLFRSVCLLWLATCCWLQVAKLLVDDTKLLEAKCLEAAAKCLVPNIASIITCVTGQDDFKQPSTDIMKATDALGLVKRVETAWSIHAKAAKDLCISGVRAAAEELSGATDDDGIVHCLLLAADSSADFVRFLFDQASSYTAEVFDLVVATTAAVDNILKTGDSYDQLGHVQHARLGVANAIFNKALAETVAVSKILAQVTGNDESVPPELEKIMTFLDKESATLTSSAAVLAVWFAAVWL